MKDTVLRGKWLLSLGVITATLLVPRPLRAQEAVPGPVSAKHTFSLGAGLVDLRFRDTYLSPTPFNSQLFAPFLRYRLGLGEVAHEVEMTFSMADIDPNHQFWKMRQYQGSVSYLFVKDVQRWNVGPLPAVLSAGVGLSSSAAHTDLTTDFPGHLPDYDATWYWTHSVLLHVRNTVQLAGGLHLDLRLTIPAFSLVGRPGQGHWMNSRNNDVSQSFWRAAIHGKGEFIWNNPALRGGLELHRSFAGGGELWVRYGWDFNSSDTPSQMRTLLNTFQGGFSFGF